MESPLKNVVAHSGGLVLALVAFLATSPSSIEAQDKPQKAIDTTHAIATREELEKKLAEIERLLSSSGYSSAIQDRKRLEADLIRFRLKEGDFNTGDRIVYKLFLNGQPHLQDSAVVVTAARSVIIPDASVEISLVGVLRSELQDHLTKELKTYYKDPKVETKTFIRLWFSGAVSTTGEIQIPADDLLGTALQRVGLTAGAKPEKSKVKRHNKEVADGKAFREAINAGMTVDRFNLQAGDEIQIGFEKPRGGFLSSARDIVYVVGGITSFVFLAGKIF
jgi:hypothetical protein